VIRIELSSTIPAIVGMFARVAPMFPASIARTARFVASRQITGIAHKLASGLETVAAERQLAGETCHTHFAFSAGSFVILFAERTRRLVMLFIFRGGQTFAFGTVILQFPHKTFLFGNACVTVACNRSRLLSLHLVRV